MQWVLIVYNFVLDSYETANQMHKISKIYFVMKLYMFRASSVSIIRSYLVYTRHLVRFMWVM